MRGVALTFLFAFVFFVLSSQVVSGETFAPVDMYISSGSNGQLKIEKPTGSNVESLTIADGETGQGQHRREPANRAADADPVDSHGLWI